MASGSSASSRNSNKPTKVHGMQTLQNFFSPSPTKSTKKMAGKQDEKNTTTAAVVSTTTNRRGKRQRIPAAGSSKKAPLRPLDDNDDDTRDEKQGKNKRKSASNQEEEEGSIGLYRIGSWENESSLSLTAPKKDVHILRVGAILGRNVSGGRRSSSTSKKLDLGIPLSSAGVSRKQLKIIGISSDSVSIRQDKPPNSVGLYRYNKEKQSMDPRVFFLGEDETTTLVPGDVIEFDNYNRGTERLLPPQHVFRVVTVAPTSTVTIEEEDSECEIVEPAKKKKKRQVVSKKDETTSSSAEPMEIDSVPADKSSSSNSKESQVFVGSVASPEEESFHTAHESQSSNTTTSLPSPPRPKVAKVAIASVAMNEAPEGTQAKQPTVQSGEEGIETVNDAKSKDGAAESSPAPGGSSDAAGNAPSANTVTFADNGATPTVQVAQKKDNSSSSKEDKDTATSKEKVVETEPVDAKMAARPNAQEELMIDNEEGADVPPPTTPVVRTPKVGDRFRAVYDREKEVSDNFLGFARPSWYFGTATNVKRKGKSRKMYSIEVEFDDKSTDTIDYPTADTQILTVEGDEAFVEMEDGSRVVAYEGTLTDISVGDLVDGRYQAGAENGSWFRGRVASVNAAAGTCDVAYFDKEYERNIPIARTNLCRLERGRANPLWLEGLVVPGGGRIVKLGEIDNGSSPNHALVLKLKFSGGRFESKTYAEVIPKVFERILKSTSRAKQKVWPTVPEVIPKVKTFPIQHRRERRAEKMKRYADAEIESGDEYQAAAVERQDDLQDEATTEITIPASNEVPAAICTTFLGAVRSTQPEVGVEFLSQLLTSFNSIPTAAPTKTLYQMAVFGPKHDGTHYPDPHKSELVTNYLIGACNRNEEMRRRLNELTMSSWDNVEEVLARVAEKIYRRDRDERSSSNDALSRITNSLQVVANGLQLMLNLVEYQLTPLIQETAGAGQLRDQQFVRALRDNDGGIREALKFVVRMAAHAWSTFGHFRVGDMKKLYEHEPCPSQASVQCCEKQVRRVLDSFGRLTSYVAWVYSADEEVRMDTKKFASVIVDVLNSELSHKTALNKYSEKVKLEFALSLVFDGEEFAAPLQLKVAEVLGLRKKYPFLFDV